MSFWKILKMKLNIIPATLLSFALFFSFSVLYAQLPAGLNKDKSQAAEQTQVPSVDLTTEDIAKTVGSAVSKFGSSMDYLVKNNTLKDLMFFIIVLLVCCLVLIPIFRYGLSKISGSSSSGKKMKLYKMILKDVKNPLNLLCITLSVNISQRFFLKLGDFSFFVDKLYVFMYCISFFWMIYNLVSIIEALILLASEKTGSREENKSGAIFARKVLRVFVGVFACMFILDAVFSQNMGTWLAGLGIVGLALSLAAQDTLKNFLGSVMVLFDRPFKLGDRIVIAGYDGIVQEMGFRSTKLKLLSGDLAYIPNSTLVNSEIDNVSKRDYINKTIDLSLVYQTSPQKIQEAIDIVKRISNEDWIKDKLYFSIGASTYEPRVFFSDFLDSSLNVKVCLWYKGNDYWTFMQDMSTLNSKILTEYNQVGLDFAYPTSTLFVNNTK